MKTRSFVVGTVLLIGLAVLAPNAEAQSVHCPWKSPQDILVKSLDQTLGELTPISKEQILQDLDCLKRVFTKGYVARSYYQERGVDLVANLKNFEKSISEPMDQAVLMKNLLALHDHAYDMHMSYAFNTQSVVYKEKQPPYAIYTADAPGLVEGISCPGFDALPSIDDQGVKGTRLVGQFNHDPAATVGCTDQSGAAITLPVRKVSLNSLGADAGQFSYSMIVSGGRNVLYVRIPTYQFPGGIPETHQKFLQFLDQQTEDVPMIVDQRQGNGGDPHFAVEILKRLASTKQKLSLTTAKVQLGSMGLGGFANEFFIRWKQAEVAGNIDSAQSFEAAYLGVKKQFDSFAWIPFSLDLFINLTQIYPGTKPGLRLEPYSQPVVVLTDKGCGSACEFVPALFEPVMGKQTVTVIGTHTGGYIHFSSPGKYILPNSKIVFTGGSFGLGFDKTVQVPEEGLGQKPDFYTVDSDGLAAALALIAKH